MKKYSIPLACALTFFVFGVATLSHYGINWDEPHRLMRGHSYLQFFLTGKTSYGLPERLSPNLITPGSYVSRYDLEAAEQDNHPAVLPDRPLPQTQYRATGAHTSYFQHDAWNGNYFLRYDTREIGHLPLPELLAATFNRIFFQGLGVLGDIESSHLPYIFISALGVFFVGAFTLDITGSRFASLISALSLSLFPLYWGEAHFNMKDPLIASLFAGSIWSFFHWVTSNKTKWFVVWCVFIALSLAVKWNILFFPFVVLPWLWSIRWRPKNLLLKGVVAFIAIFAFLTFIWPTSWQDPIRAFIDVARSYIALGTGGKSIEPRGFFFLGFNFYPIALLFSQTPEITLVLLGSALIFRRAHILILLWLLVPILRYSLPPARVYSGLRQIMEVIPALAVLSGIGASRIHKPFLRMLVVSFFVPVAVTIASLHPNENAYFNGFVGGLSGATRKNLVDFFLTNGNVYRQGATWLNIHAQKDANVALLDGRTFSLSPLFLRSDISISPYHFSGFSRKGEYILILQSPIERAIFSYEYVRRFLVPLYEITVDGTAILSLYKNDAAYLRPDYARESELLPGSFRQVGQGERGFIELNLGQEQRVTAIELAGAPKNCYLPNHFADVDSLITFLPEVQPKNWDPSAHIFGLNERASDGEGGVTYYFPGERARRIRISPVGSLSCFRTGVITGVRVLAESLR